jgi:hypothetical protein
MSGLKKRKVANGWVRCHRILLSHFQHQLPVCGYIVDDDELGRWSYRDWRNDIAMVTELP